MILTNEMIRVAAERASVFVPAEGEPGRMNYVQSPDEEEPRPYFVYEADSGGEITVFFDEVTDQDKFFELKQIQFGEDK